MDSYSLFSQPEILYVLNYVALLPQNLQGDLEFGWFSIYVLMFPSTSQNCYSKKKLPLGVTGCVNVCVCAR